MHVRITRLEISYEDFKLVAENLSMPPSRLTALIGPNGAGKTTLLKALAGLQKLPGGAVYINGQDLSRLKDSQRTRLVSYVPQEFSTAFNYGVLDFVLMGRSGYLNIFASPSASDYRQAEAVLDYLGLQRFREKKCLELSSGERRLVLIARALVQDTEVIILDEPTTFLDIKHEMEIAGLLRKLVEEKKKTVICSIHSLDLLPKLADQLVMIKNGRILASGPTPEVFRSDLLEKLFDFPLKVDQINGHVVVLR